MEQDDGRPVCLRSFEQLLQFVSVKPTTTWPSITVTGVVMYPSFSSSFNAASSAAMFRSTNSILLCERNSFTFAQNIQPG